MVAAALKELGGIGRIVKPGDYVVLKPNAGFANPAAWGTTTHPDVVVVMAKACLDAKAKQVTVVEFPQGKGEKCLERCGLTTALSAHTTLTHSLLWSVPLVVLTVVFDRFFCGWICPMGVLHHATTWLGRKRRIPERVAQNRPRDLYRLKYLVLLVVLGMAVLGSNQAGLLDPISFTWRALATSLLPALDNALGGPYQGLRHFHWSTLIGALFIAAVALNLAIPRLYCRMLCPLGALPEEDFLGRCVKCGACMKVCPTSGLQPALTQAGLEGLWSPILVPRLGYCEQSCVLCGQVCPTGAIRHLSLPEKLGEPPHEEPVRIGSAFVDRGRCLPWAMDTPCIVCEEVCPTSPKAVYFKLEKVTTRDGKALELKQPYVDIERCTGCGICETRCPVFDQAAIRVTSVGETRSLENRILLKSERV